jgi:hypothetical protein
MTEPPADQPESLADRQLADARRDPRLTHGREAVVADWWAAMGAAERARTLADWGLQELLDSEDHEKRRLEVEGRTDPDDPRRRAAIEAARERADLARAEKDNQLVEHNGMTLISMVGALDALVEDLVPRVREMLTEHRARVLVERAREQATEAAAQIDTKVLEAVLRTAQEALAEQLGSFDSSPRGAGVKRWEEVLFHAGLQAPPERPMPEDLDQALTEVVALRHVLAHRAGRVDPRALKQAPSLCYADGDLARITRADYRRYSAALWTYGEEVNRRLLGDLAPAPAPPLTDWRQNYTLNA